MSEELDPSVFVERIRQLGNQRDQQDAERVRKLEEEIQQGRSERLARRAGMSAVLLHLVPLWAVHVGPLLIVFCIRTSPYAVARQAHNTDTDTDTNTAVAAVCRRHRHAHISNGAPVAAVRPGRFAAAPHQPARRSPRGRRTEEDGAERGSIGPVGHALVAAKTAVQRRQRTAASLNGSRLCRQECRQLTSRHARAILAREAPLPKPDRAVTGRKGPVVVQTNVRPRSWVGRTQAEPGGQRFGRWLSGWEEAAAGTVTRLDRRARGYQPTSRHHPPNFLFASQPDEVAVACPRLAEASPTLGPRGYIARWRGSGDLGPTAGHVADAREDLPRTPCIAYKRHGWLRPECNAQT
jgi:hypothetical protein